MKKLVWNQIFCASKIVKRDIFLKKNEKKMTMQFTVYLYLR